MCMEELVVLVQKLKRREGSGSTGRFFDSVLKPLILFCDWRGLIKESPR